MVTYLYWHFILIAHLPKIARLASMNQHFGGTVSNPCIEDHAVLLQLDHLFIPWGFNIHGRLIWYIHVILLGGIVILWKFIPGYTAKIWAGQLNKMRLWGNPACARNKRASFCRDCKNLFFSKFCLATARSILGALQRHSVSDSNWAPQDIPDWDHPKGHQSSRLNET